MSDQEVRVLQHPVEFREDPPDKEGGESRGVISGYAAVFYDGSPGTEFQIDEDLAERIMPGAFDELLASDTDVVALVSHNPQKPLGRRSAGTLRLSVDKRGLLYEVDLGASSVAQDARDMVRRKDFKGSSFTFGRPPGERFIREDGRDVRIIDNFGTNVGDVGPGTFPAYEETTAEARTVLRSRLDEQQREQAADRSKRIREMDQRIKDCRVEIAQSESK